MSEPAPPQTIRWSGMTHVGRVRSNNEDAFLALTFDANGIRFLGKEGNATLNGADFVFAVSDGMGGAHSGEFASRIAVDRITHLLPRSFRFRAQGLATGFEDILDELLESIHRELLKLGQCYEECHGMGATLSLTWFTPGWMCFAHIGDSRIYYLPREGGLQQITHDHSHVGWLRRNGKINEREQRTHPRRNAINQALGAGHQFINPHIGAVGCEPGDRFLLCTDGLTDGLWDRAIGDIIRAPAPTGSAAQRLVQAALAESGRDNITALIVET